LIVAVDAQLAVGTATGIGEYVSGLCAQLRSTAGVSVVELQEPALDPWRFDRRVFWDQWLLPRRARASGAQLLHCASGTMPLRLPLPAIVTVHDVAWLKVQRRAKFYARYYFGRFSLSQYARARAVAVDSDFSRKELLTVLDAVADRVRVVYPGVAPDFCKLHCTPSEDAFLLVPGTVEPRKNLETLVRALALAPRARLVVAGPPTPYAQECAHLAFRLGVADRLDLRGYVTRAELLRLYATCTAVLVPSLYEGFGYAAAQALCAGVPLLSSDRASLPEVVGGQAPLVDACDHAAWGAQITALLEDPLQAQRRAAQARDRAIARFGWRASAEAMLDAYAFALGGNV
jgi:glycosyltransferase involved in cell wall biosynthesis